MIRFTFAFWLIYFATKIIRVLFIPKKSKPKTVLFMENFPIENAGYQYRAAKWIPYFEKNGYNIKVWTIEEDKAKFDNYLAKKRIAFLIKSMFKRFMQIIKSNKFETVIVRRELLLYNDYGNLFMEKFLLKLHPNAILDFDDDIAAAKGQPKEITNWYARLMLENGNKFNESLQLYKKFIVGSNYLKGELLKKIPQKEKQIICIIPTCVDYEKTTPKEYQIRKNTPIKFGWIGGNHNYFLLQDIIPHLDKLSTFKSIELIVIGGEKFKCEANFKIKFIPWSIINEKENLKKIDIGLMPLRNDKKSKGKCGFKLIQYMGLGIVSIASAVTINNEIIKDKENSFLVKDNNEWYDILNTIIDNKDNYQKIGEKARITIKNNYTFSSNIENLLNFIS